MPRPWSAGPATYGTAAIDPATGEWTYTLDNGQTAVQDLGEGDTLTDSFLVTVTDEDGLTDTRDRHDHHHRQRRCAGDQRRWRHGRRDARTGTLVATGNLTRPTWIWETSPSRSGAGRPPTARRRSTRRRASGPTRSTTANGRAGAGRGRHAHDSFLVTVTDEDGLTDTLTVHAHHHRQRRCAGDQCRWRHGRRDRGRARWWRSAISTRPTWMWATTPQLVGGRRHLRHGVDRPGDGRVDLHAQQRPSGRAGAGRGRHAQRQLPGDGDR